MEVSATRRDRGPRAARAIAGTRRAHREPWMIRRGLYATLLFSAAFWVWLIVRPASSAVVVAVDDVGNAVGPIAAIAWFVIATRPWRRPQAPARRDGGWWAPLLMVVGVLCFAIGQMVWTYFEQILDRPTPFPSLADGGYLVAHVFLLAGVLLLPNRFLMVASRARVLVNGLLVMTAVVTFSWYFVLGPTLLQGAESLLAIVVGTAYPLSELVLVFCLLVLSARSPNVAVRRAVPILTLALAVIAVADGAYDYQLIRGTYSTGSLLDPAWALGWMLVALGALSISIQRDIPEQALEVQGDEHSPLPVGVWAHLAHVWKPLLPYAVVPAVLLLLVYAWTAQGDMRLKLGVYIGGGLLLAFVFLHQILVILENVEVNLRLRALWKVTAEEQALRSSERRFRRLIEGMHVGVFLVGARGEIVVCNGAALTMLGLVGENVVGKSFVDVTGGRGRSAICSTPEQQAVATALTTKQPVWSVVSEVPRSGSGPVSLLVDAIPQLAADGSVEHVICSFIDITERREAEEALRASEARFRSIFELAPIGFEIADMDGRFVQTNKALQEMLGYEEGELDGKHWSEIAHPEDVEEEEKMDAMLVTGAIDQYQLENRHIRKDGDTVWTRQTVTEVWDRGEPVFAIAMVEDISERKRAQEALAHQALHDALTDLPNRVLLHDRVHQAILASRRDGVPFVLMVMDLDRFKEINDSFGHLYGDMLLQQLGTRLVRSLREMDTVARLGGDEFAVLLPAADEQGALRSAGKILKAVQNPFVLEGHRFAIEASIGIALFPEHGDDPHTLLRQADVAMYIAKRSHSGYAVYSPDQDENTPTRLLLLGELRQAIDSGALTLYYQPKVNLRSGRIESVEALVRWNHPQRGLMLPDEFVPLAEHTGLIRSLDIHVLSAGLKQAAEWNSAGLPIRVAVNLSARHLQDPDLEQAIIEVLDRWQVPASMLEVEITESVVMADPLYALRILNRLRDMGIRISIDDFGTGYSSLAYLQRLPVDEIKIDKSFVMNMAAHHDDTFIARSVIDLGHNLNLQVVAEGVESQAVADLLAGMGCDVAQGYFYGTPLPAPELLPLLRRSAKTVSCLPLPARGTISA